MVSGVCHFNPRPPCGGRLITDFPDLIGGQISIHGPRVGADSNLRSIYQAVNISIHGPRVGADTALNSSRARQKISIHGPRVGADSWHSLVNMVESDFNPRPPCGGRPMMLYRMQPDGQISIHGPRVGADSLNSPEK